MSLLGDIKRITNSIQERKIISIFGLNYEELSWVDEYYQQQLSNYKSSYMLWVFYFLRRYPTYDEASCFLRTTVKKFQEVLHGYIPVIARVTQEVSYYLLFKEQILSGHQRYQ